MITIFQYSKRCEPRNTRKLHNVFSSASAALNIQCTLPAATPRLPTQRRMCHYYSAELPTQRLIKLQFRDRLRIRTHRGRPLIIPGFRCQVCRLVSIASSALRSASKRSSMPVGSADCCTSQGMPSGSALRATTRPMTGVVGGH